MSTIERRSKIEVDAERNLVRSVIYHTMQSLMQPVVGAEGQIRSLNETIKTLEATGAGAPGSPLRGILDGKITELSNLTTGNMGGIAWSDMVNRLAERIEVQNCIKEVWESRDPGEGRFSDATRLVEFLLLREFGRRPRGLTQSKRWDSRNSQALQLTGWQTQAFLNHFADGG
jgi:hypothetical protein